jgi:chitin disaccharide deacetylase
VKLDRAFPNQTDGIQSQAAEDQLGRQRACLWAGETASRISAWLTRSLGLGKSSLTAVAVRANKCLCSIWKTLGQTFSERLGWKGTDVVVILHVDDAGMSHSSNLGATEATGRGVATSCSVMMPCSWVPEMARYLKAHPDLDSGVHLTLTSEWQLYRWGPLAGKLRVPGLVDKEGCLWHSVEEVARSATPDEIEKELRAQIERAETLGIPITHLDSHMGTVFVRPDYFERFAKIGIEKGVVSF